MSEDSNINDMIRNVSNAVRREVTANIVERTRHLFRPRMNGAERGRRRQSVFKRKLFILRLAHADFLPATYEQAYLAKRGLGKISCMALINRQWNLGDIKNYVLSILQGNIADLLSLTDFHFGKCDKKKRIFPITIQNATELEDSVKNGSIIVIPEKDLPTDLPIVSIPFQQPEGYTSDEEFVPRERSRRIIPDTSINQSNVPVLPEDNESSNEVHGNYINNMESTEENNPSRTVLQHYLMNQVDGYLESVTDNVPFIDGEISCHNYSVSFIEFPKLPTESENINIEISRQNCVEELLELYKDKDMLKKTITVSFIGEGGLDAGGLTKELFNLFFKKIEEQYFIGEDCLVPHLPLHRIRRDKDNFELIGRILSHMSILTQSLPSRISRIIFYHVGNLDADVDKNVLIEDFILHISLPERILVKKALNSFTNLTASEHENLINLFTYYKFYELPKESEFSEQIVCLAQDLFIEKPKNLVIQIKKGIPEKQIQSFWSKCTISDLTKILSDQRPTVAKILDCIMTVEEHLTNEQNTVLHFLKNYLQMLDSDQLLQFILFVTGSYNMPSHITVAFTNLTGLSRRPITHTCSQVLELSAMYDSFQDFKREMNCYLFSEYSFEYSQL